MLVALHGFTETDLTWRDYLGSAIPARCPLLAGHGWKPCPPTTTLSSAGDEVAKGMSANDDLLGYSLGGRVALHLALDHPGQVRRLILISCNAGIVDPVERETRRRRDERLAQILEEDGISPFVAWWEANPALKPAKKIPRKVQEALRCLRLNQDPQTLAGVLRTMSHGLMAPLWDRLPTIRIPTLLVAGDHDQNYCKRMGEMAERIPNARLVVVKDSGHAVHREQPDELRRLISEFLA